MGVYPRIPFPAWAILSGLRELFSLGDSGVVEAGMDKRVGPDKARATSAGSAGLRWCMGLWLGHGPDCKRSKRASPDIKQP